MEVSDYRDAPNIPNNINIIIINNIALSNRLKTADFT